MDRIHVTVRARPLSPDDAKTSLWRISGNSIFIPNHSSMFEFDQVFDENSKTSEVYETRTKDIVAAAVSGFNGTVFAYGQTNSGKTHTMRGSKAEPGVIPRAVQDLFHILQQDVDREFLLRMSYMEIYNEEINDLLVPEHRKLQIHENIERGIYVAGLREEIVTSSEQVLNLMEFGESHRHIGETNMNLYSSRSHTIFRMIIESRDRNEDESTSSSCDAVRVSVLNLVDLAGSERAAKTGAEGVRLKEGSHINKSLMTLGTVIKKLSEGVESQGGHVPYRDSKLTRILQPALGGNANTAIICNITLAQIHTDETKSSLQFASRALRVTNCAKINEIMTDAALLKRQKKEIEELRAKLTGFRSEHLEEEILSLRNTLLQSELERERIALELEEKKKTQGEWEKRVHEQAKRIENLSSMVLFSNRDESVKYTKKEKRRETWCPGNISQTHLKDVHSSIHTDVSTTEPIRPKLEMGPLVPFNKLLDADFNVDDSCKKEEDDKGDANVNHNLPNPRALLLVTNRKRDSSRKKRLSMQEDNKYLQQQAEYDSLRETEAILVIKRLQEQINVLEMEKLSSQQNLDTVYDLATEQNVSAREKIEELNNELIKAQEAARLANEQLISSKTVNNIDDENVDFIASVSMEIEDVMSEVQNSKEAVQSVILMIDDATKSFSTLCHIFLDFKTSISQDSAGQKLIFNNCQKLNSSLTQTISELENQKILLDSQLSNIQKLLEESKLDAQSSHNSLQERFEQQELENQELISYIQTLEKEIVCLTSSSVAKEKETLRKDFEKAKTKMKETESKLKIAMQEKTKLEGEKAYAEREIKRLHGQNSRLERDISKHDSLAGKSSKMFDTQRPKDLAFSLEEYKELEVFAFESETRITSLEEEISAVLKEKEEVISINEALKSELEDLTDKLVTSASEIYDLKEEISAVKQRLGESDVNQEKLKSSIKELVEEKKELSMQLTNALLEIEEERAIWSAKEKAALLAIEEQARSNTEKITSLSTELSENLKIKLSTVTEERDKLMIEMEDQQKHVTEVELLLKHCQDELSREKDHMKELSDKISSMEVKMHADKVTNINETAQFRMMLRGTQAKLDAHRLRYKEAIEESDASKIKYREASEKLKDMLRSQGLELMDLKKQLAAAK
ncbi:kinesin-like protein KIN-7O [Vicia villosa]|uniref:kinesin-like protein KIN-7O n=1 Tax=Vicia villosa TaxID=3911 RepID=UPI00273AEFA4|nr:kinesin-like protein KIN-7O [Vicia villosa]